MDAREVGAITFDAPCKKTHQPSHILLPSRGASTTVKYGAAHHKNLGNHSSTLLSSKCRHVHYATINDNKYGNKYIYQLHIKH